MTDIEARIEEIKDRAKRWGKLHNEKVTHDELLAIIEHFEAIIMDQAREFRAQERAHRQRADQINQRHATEKAQLTGKIGGLQKTINRLKRHDDVELS